MPDFFRANGTAYLVMDFEDGLPLSELLQQREAANDPLDEDEVKRIILPLLEGLAVVHAHDVLHRDIKPANIFIRRATEQPVLIDFGAAKQDYSQHSKSAWAYTEGYAPIEQVEEAGKLGPWTDIYAIGATMWRIIAAANPPKVESRLAALLRDGPDPLTPAVEVGKGQFSPAFLQVVDKCLALKEQSRYQSVAELLAALGAEPSGAGVPGQQAAAPELAKTGRAALPKLASAAINRSKNRRNDTAQWWRKAAEQGHAGAQEELGWMYLMGVGVEKDKVKAVEWYRKAAEQGYARAQSRLRKLGESW